MGGRVGREYFWFALALLVVLLDLRRTGPRSSC